MNRETRLTKSVRRQSLIERAVFVAFAGGIIALVCMHANGQLDIPTLLSQVGSLFKI